MVRRFPIRCFAFMLMAMLLPTNWVRAQEEIAGRITEFFEEHIDVEPTFTGAEMTVILPEWVWDVDCTGPVGETLSYRDGSTWGPVHALFEVYRTITDAAGNATKPAFYIDTHRAEKKWAEWSTGGPTESESQYFSTDWIVTLLTGEELPVSLGISQTVKYNVTVDGGRDVRLDQDAVLERLSIFGTDTEFEVGTGYSLSVNEKLAVEGRVDVFGNASVKGNLSNSGEISIGSSGILDFGPDSEYSEPGGSVTLTGGTIKGSPSDTMHVLGTGTMDLNLHDMFDVIGTPETDILLKGTIQSDEGHLQISDGAKLEIWGGGGGLVNNGVIEVSGEGTVLQAMWTSKLYGSGVVDLVSGGEYALTGTPTNWSSTSNDIRIDSSSKMTVQTAPEYTGTGGAEVSGSIHNRGGEIRIEDHTYLNTFATTEIQDGGKMTLGSGATYSNVSGGPDAWLKGVKTADGTGDPTVVLNDGRVRGRVDGELEFQGTGELDLDLHGQANISKPDSNLLLKGTVQSTGAYEVSDGATARIFQGQEGLRNDGSIEVSGAGTELYFGPGGKISGDGQVSIKSDAEIIFENGGTSNGIGSDLDIDADSTMIVRTKPGLTRWYTSTWGTTTNQGTMNIQESGLENSGYLQNDGQVNLGSDSYLSLLGSGVLQNDGQMSIGSGGRLVVTHSGTLTGTGEVMLDDGEVYFDRHYSGKADGDLRFSGTGTLLMDLIGQATISGPDTDLVVGHTVRTTGQYNVSGAATARIYQGAEGLRNDGVIEVSGAGAVLQTDPSSKLTGDGVVNLTAGGELRLTGTSSKWSSVGNDIWMDHDSKVTVQTAPEYTGTGGAEVSGSIYNRGGEIRIEDHTYLNTFATTEIQDGGKMTLGSGATYSNVSGGPDAWLKGVKTAGGMGDPTVVLNDGRVRGRVDGELEFQGTGELDLDLHGQANISTPDSALLLKGTVQSTGAYKACGGANLEIWGGSAGLVNNGVIEVSGEGTVLQALWTSKLYGSGVVDLVSGGEYALTGTPTNWSSTYNDIRIDSSSKTTVQTAPEYTGIGGAEVSGSIYNRGGEIRVEDHTYLNTFATTEIQDGGRMTLGSGATYSNVSGGPDAWLRGVKTAGGSGDPTVVLNGSRVRGNVDGELEFQGTGELDINLHGQAGVSGAGSDLRLKGTVQSTASYQASNGATIRAFGVENNGAIEVSGAGTSLEIGPGLRLSGSGDVVVNTGGELQMLRGQTTNDVEIDSTSKMTIKVDPLVTDTSYVLGSTTNNGTINVDAPLSLRHVYNSGQININSRFDFTELVLDGGSINGAAFSIDSDDIVRGNGTINGDVYSAGLISPGFSPGLLEINGDLTLGSASVLEMEIYGGLPGEYDRIMVTGNFTLAGSLQVVLGDTASFDAGWAFDILTADSFTGSFNDIILPFDLYGSPMFSYGWFGDSLRLTSLQAYNMDTQAVPLPGAALLGVIGMAVAGWKCRRQAKRDQG